MSASGRHLPEGLVLDRRAFHRHLARLGLAAVAVPILPWRASAAGDLAYFTWAGYEVPELHLAYVQEHGGSPEISFFADEEEALTKIRGGFAVDVSHPCTSSVSRWFDAGIIQPLDPARLRNWPDLIDVLKTIPGTVHGDAPVFVPTDWGSNSIAYRTDLVDPAYAAEESWGLLFDERYKGRLAMWESVDGAVAMAAAMLGIEDTDKVTEEQFESIRDLLARQKELLRFYWSSETEAETALAQGEIVACYLWSAPVLRLQEAGVPVAYMARPKEGVVSFCCGLVLMKDAPGDGEAAYDFINAWTDPEAGKFLVEQYGYGHSNRRTYELIDDAVLAAQGLTRDVSSYLASSSFFQSWSPAMRERYVRMYEEIRSGA